MRGRAESPLPVRLDPGRDRDRDRDTRKWLALAGVTIPSVLGCIDFTIVNTALPVIQQDLNAGIDALQWIVNGFLLALSTFMILAGRAADRHGRRRVLYIGLTGFALSSLCAGIAPDIRWLIAARVLQGASCSILYTASASIVADVFPDAQRGRALGLLFGANGFGLAIGPALGGILVAHFGWTSIFLVNVPLIVIAFTLCAASVPETRAKDSGSLDLPGTALVLLALPLLVVGLLHGAGWGWTSPATIGVLASAGAAFALLFVVERHSAHPILPPGLLVKPAFLGSVVATAGLGAFYCTVFFLLPILLQTVLGFGSEAAGFILLAATLTVAIFSPIAGRLTDRFGTRTVLSAGFVLFIASALIQALIPVTAPLPLIVGALLLLGVGWAFILGPSTVGAIAAAPKDASGLAVGIASTIHNLGGALGLALATLVFNHAGSRALTALAGRPLSFAVVQEASVSKAYLADLIGAKGATLDTLFAVNFVTGLHAVGWFLLLLSVAALLLVIRLTPTHQRKAHA